MLLIFIFLFPTLIFGQQPVLYANLASKPSLLPSRKSEAQKKQAYIMLSDCFRFALKNTPVSFSFLLFSTEP